MPGIKFEMLLLILLGVVLVGSCSSTGKTTAVTDAEKVAFQQQEGDTVSIENPKLEYQIIIIEPGFYTWLQSTAKPEGYYSQPFLEARNQIYVINWNQRVLQPFQYDPILYEMQINYDPLIDYGYEVNYQLYNYFIYFQRKYRQRLGPFVPRI